MECDGDENLGVVNVSIDDNAGASALNSTILNYYKKFGKKRDLEQYFSLSTAQGDIKDPSSLFWRRMKSQSDSDSGEKRSEASMEICRISIKCTVPDNEPSSSQDDIPKTKSDTDSPPIVIEEVPEDASRHTDDESVKSDDNHSQKSMDVMLDTSMNKPFSPTSSITSQRKLEWDSLADVGYANETDRKTSSNLSTLERLALKQQYSNNDTLDPTIGAPTAHSTPQEEMDIKSKAKKGSGKTTKIYRRDVDFLEVNVPHGSEMNPTQAINVNLTKHISFNVEKNGGVTVENVQKDVSVEPKKVSVETAVTPLLKQDKEIQTSLLKAKDKSLSTDMPKSIQGIPVLINLNTLKKRPRRTKLRSARKRLRCKKNLDANKENLPVQEKSGEQVSEAESFEYMPGHIYNQNQMKNDQPTPSHVAGNKSSLESSGALTTDSSKESKRSFSKDLEKSIKLLKSTLQKRYDSSNLKDKLIKEIVQRLVTSSYRGDDSTTDFLSGLSFSSKKLGLGESIHTTTSTSDGNNTGDKVKLTRPKKSILRSDKLIVNSVPSTSQSAPNLPSVSTSEKPVASKLTKPLMSSNTESDVSSKDKTSSDTAFAKTSSEELYQKYMEALRREQAYRQHLKDKETFLKQKLVSSAPVLKLPARVDVKNHNRLKNLIQDLTRNNYDDGSGDASKLEGGSNSNIVFESAFRPHRSHSVFTLSSGTSENRKADLRKNDKGSHKCGSSNDEHYCCCPYHSTCSKLGVVDSSVQVNIKQPIEEEKGHCTNCNKQTRNIARVVSDNTGDIKYVCLCNQKPEDIPEASDNFLIYKCSRLDSKGIQYQEIPSNMECAFPSTSKKGQKTSQSSQTNLALKLKRKDSAKSTTSTSSGERKCGLVGCGQPSELDTPKNIVHETIRCIQTEISIDPKISDPCLSDINIVNDADCVKIIGERYREISKSTIPSDPTDQRGQVRLSDFSEHNLQGDPDQKAVQISRKKSFTPLKLSQGIQSNIENIKEASNELDIGDGQNNFTIPIQGTNMTLMVSLGSNLVEPQNERLTHVLEPDTVFLKEIERSHCEQPQVADACIGEQALNDSNRVNEVNTLFTRQRFFDSIYQQDTPFLLSNENAGLLNPKCKCPASQCIGYCGKDCVTQKPCLVSETDTENMDKNQETLRSIGIGTGCDQSLFNRPKCKCPQSAKCGGVCGQDAECMKAKSSLRPDNDDVGKNVSVETPCCQILSDKPKCKCPQPSKCRGLCGQDAECMKAESFPPSNTEKDLGTYCLKLPDTSSFPDKPKCKCPELSKCGGTCGIDAECMKSKLVSRSNPDTPKDSPRLFGSGQRPPNKSKVATDSAKPKPFICSDTYTGDTGKEKKSPQNTENICDFNLIPTKHKCMCPESSKCGGMCGKDAKCMKKKPVDDPEKCTYYVSPRETVPEKPKCTCPASAKCKGTCKEDAPCIIKKDTETQRDISEGRKYNTLPKIVKITNHKQLLRSHTDVSDYEPDSSVKYQVSSETTGKTSIRTQPQSKSKSSDNEETATSKDLVLDMIQDITKRYSKKDIAKNQRKKCFKEIMSVLNYLLDTEDIPDPDHIKALISSTTQDTEAGYSTVRSEEKPICDHPKSAQVKDSTSKCSECGVVKNSQESSGSVFCQIKESVDSCQQPVLECSEDTDYDVCAVEPKKKEIKCYCQTKVLVDKGVQLSTKKSKVTRVVYTESSDLPASTDRPCTSSDSATCKILNKIKKECDKYHQKRCCGGKKCEASSSTSVNCENCKRVHHCYCRAHKCRHRPRSTLEKIKKKCVAYNLIIQTSESMISEETLSTNNRPLKNIVVKVPPKHHCANVPFKEMSAKIEERLPCSSPRCRCRRSRSLPSESGLSSGDENIRKCNIYTVREYLEKNRPDFVDKCSKRQKCLKLINESRANERATSRKLLSMQLQMDGQAALSSLSESDLRRLAKELGVDSKRKKVAPKFISEREMKKHSERIYKSLPEVVQKKENAKKESIKKTNLLMANIFKKNLQKKTLSGAVNLSNYSTVVKI